MKIHGYDRSIGDRSPERYRPPGVGRIGNCCEVPATRDYGIGSRVHATRYRPGFWTVGGKVHNQQRGVGQTEWFGKHNLDNPSSGNGSGWFDGVFRAAGDALGNLTKVLPDVIRARESRKTAEADANKWSGLTHLAVIGGLGLAGLVILGKVLR